MKIYKVDGHIIKVSDYAPEYDSNLCANGGSYYQPYTTASCPARNEGISIDDTSCGDFGGRIHVTLYKRGKAIASAYYGTMLSELEKYSTFSRKNPIHVFWLNFAAQYLEYCLIPYKEDERSNQV